jgi:hypothetical protein
MDTLNQRMGNMQLQDRPRTPPNQSTNTDSAPAVKRKQHIPHQFSPGFKGKKLDGRYGTGQPPQRMPGGRKKRRRKSRRKSRKKKRKSRKGKKKRKTRRKKKSRRRRR